MWPSNFRRKFLNPASAILGTKFSSTRRLSVLKFVCINGGLSECRNARPENFKYYYSFKNLQFFLFYHSHGSVEKGQRTFGCSQCNWKSVLEFKLLTRHSVCTLKEKVESQNQSQSQSHTTQTYHINERRCFHWGHTRRPAFGSHFLGSNQASLQDFDAWLMKDTRPASSVENSSCSSIYLWFRVGWCWNAWHYDKKYTIHSSKQEVDAILWPILLGLLGLHSIGGKRKNHESLSPYIYIHILFSLSWSSLGFKRNSGYIIH